MYNTSLSDNGYLSVGAKTIGQLIEEPIERKTDYFDQIISDTINILKRRGGVATLFTSDQVKVIVDLYGKEYVEVEEYDFYFYIRLVPTISSNHISLSLQEVC